VYIYFGDFSTEAKEFAPLRIFEQLVTLTIVQNEAVKDLCLILTFSMYTTFYTINLKINLQKKLSLLKFHRSAI